MSLPPIDYDEVQAIREELHDQIGMTSVKRQVEGLIAGSITNRDRIERGLPPNTDKTNHLMFVGPAGTGKTTTARMIAGLYTALGVLPGTDGRCEGDFLEVDRSKLVGSHIGESEKMTREAFEKARGGVLFIDEAYALKHSDQDMYGQQAIDVLMKLMEDHRDDTVVILAGYPHEMERLVKSNPGLASRLPTTIHFPEYSDSELRQIMSQRMGELEYRGAKGTKTALDAAVGEVGAGNARNVRNLQQAILDAQELRLASGRGQEAPGRRTLQRLTPEDVAAGLADYKAKQLTAPEKPKRKGRLVKA